MLFIPIGREDVTIQRYAFVTYALIALNVAAFLLFCIGTSGEEDYALIRQWRETSTYLRDRPYLRVPVLAARLMPRDLQQRARVSDPSVPDWRAAKEQDELDAMAAELRERYDGNPGIRMAYVPAVGSIPTLLTSMFLHAGLVHLLGNMLFLFITAPLIEDLFGRLFFLLFYLSGGVVATLAFGWRYPATITPLVGASGAISAVMGACLVAFAMAKIRFLFVPVIFLPFWNFTFSLPALLVLPLWFLDQVVSITVEGENGGVAVTAHVAGFAYGAIVAAFVKVATRAKRPARPAAAKEPVVKADPRIAHLRVSLQNGDLDSAWSEVNGILAKEPENAEAIRAALEIAAARKDTQKVDALATRLLEKSAAGNRKTEVMQLIVEMRQHEDLPQFCARAAAVTERWGQHTDAAELLEKLVRIERGKPGSVPALYRLAAVRHALGDASAAVKSLEIALAEPGCSPEWRRRIENTLQQWARVPATTQ